MSTQPSPTAGMNIAQRILHVGGRNNAAGYVEFGSIQAVEALVRQVLRDLPAPTQQAQGVPTGMALVPIVPTEKMLSAGYEAGLQDADAWTAMLAAASQAEQKELHAELDLHSNPARDEQQRQLVGALEMGQPLGGGQNESASNPQPERAVARISGMDEYGPMIEWYTHWTRLALGTKLYAAAPQAEHGVYVGLAQRLMTLSTRLGISCGDSVEHFNAGLENNLYAICRGVERLLDAPQAEPQPIPHTLGGFRGWMTGLNGRTPTDREIWDAAIRSYRDLAEPQPEREPLSDDAINQILTEVVGDEGYHEEWLATIGRPCTRAIERAHGIVLRDSTEVCDNCATPDPGCEGLFASEGKACKFHGAEDKKP